MVGKCPVKTVESSPALAPSNLPNGLINESSFGHVNISKTPINYSEFCRQPLRLLGWSTCPVKRGWGDWVRSALRGHSFRGPYQKSTRIKEELIKKMETGIYSNLCWKNKRHWKERNWNKENCILVEKLFHLGNSEAMEAGALPAHSHVYRIC